MFGAASIAVLVIMAMALARALMGPSVFDRILAVNLFGTLTVVLIPGLLGFGRRGGTGAQSHDHIHTGVLQVIGVGVTLGAVAQDTDPLSRDNGKISVFVIVNVHGFPLINADRPGSPGLSITILSCLPAARASQCLKMSDATL